MKKLLNNNRIIEVCKISSFIQYKLFIVGLLKNISKLFEKRRNSFSDINRNQFNKLYGSRKSFEEIIKRKGIIKSGYF